jgi:hypothetical protein
MPNITIKTSQLSSTRKIFVLFLLLITILILSYLIINDTKFGSSIHFSGSLLASPSLLLQINPDQCRLSLQESDGWFCELDLDWKRRKNLHHIQDKRNRISNVRPLFFQNNWEPTIQCEFERRLGPTGDGGKWVCDVHRFEQMDNKTLLIYSFGSSGDFRFERGIKEQLPTVEIHTFDSGLYICPENLCTFHQVRLGNGKTNASKSLQMVMNELGHRKRQIHILKVDIEGSEFELFEELFNSSLKQRTDVLYIRQILFEIHLGADRSAVPCQRAHQLFELFRLNNYAIFHKEANLYDAQNVFEYALLRLNSAFFNSSI